MPTTPPDPNVICTPYVGRTIKGWAVRVRICISITAAQYAAASLGNAILAQNAEFATLLDAVSDATFQPLGTSTQQVREFGASGTTDNAEDSVVLAFATTQGSVARLSVPAPNDAIFLADNQTVDPTNAAVAALVTELLSCVTFNDASGTTGSTAVASTASGAEFATFLGGLRVRRRTRRRLSIWVRNPELTAPGI